MSKVNLAEFNVEGLEVCPKCNSEKFAEISLPLGTITACCKNCNIDKEDSVIINGSISYVKNKDLLISITKEIFKFLE